MRTVGLRPMMAHLRSVILIGPLAFGVCGGFIRAPLARPASIVVPAIPESDPTNPLRVKLPIVFFSSKIFVPWRWRPNFTLTWSRNHYHACEPLLSADTPLQIGSEY